MLDVSLILTTPWVLGFLLVLPLLWWLLRLTPPAPKKIVFPALSLLRDLVTPQQTPARTPWWLLLLRSVIAALLILACAGPLLDPSPGSKNHGALLIIVDNDWAAARAWDVRQKSMHDLIHRAAREDRSVILLPTTAATSGEGLSLIGPMAATAADGEATRITPQPWAADWTQAKSLLKKLDSAHVDETVWLSSGLGNSDARALYEGLPAKDNLRVLNDHENPIYVLLPPQNDGEHLLFTAQRAITEGPSTLTVSAVTGEGNHLAHVVLNFTAGAPSATATLDLPLDIRNQIARFEIDGAPSAATTALLDASWQHRPVGLVGDKAELAQHSFLSGLFYIERALKPFADLHIDSLDVLLTQKMAVLLLTDATILTDDQVTALNRWVQQGGVLVRFAGEKLATSANPKEFDLLPVTLRDGDRALGGTLSWSTPQTLHDFPANSPFRGLDIPTDVTVARQMLAEPSPDLAARTWAALNDGTPLVTAKNLGQGISILFHVPSRSDWSNLPLSGLFVDMLRRIVDLSRGVAADSDFSSLPPWQMLDAFGVTQKPNATARPLTGNKAHVIVGPQHPPGLYGTASLSQALNLAPAVGQPEALTGIDAESYRPTQGEVDLQPYLFTAAFLLLLGDFVISLMLRGVLVMLAVLLFFAPVAFAASTNDAAALTAQTTLAYVQTGDRETDQVSESGLRGLARILQRRTSIDVVAVTGVDPNNDDLAFYPFLYWPLQASEAPLSPQGVQHVNAYLHHGGMILFDSLNGDILSPALTQHILAGIEIPPLQHAPENHVLKRSFYLLDDFPGRYASDDFWLEPETTSSYDGVATVLSGSNGWAAAWAMDESGQPQFPCTPGGEVQREHAFRFGINLVMYALTGNYKSDQLHAQELLKRMGK